MQVSLKDKEKVSMLFLGEPLNFNYDNPGPIDVELASLSSEQKNQLVYNYRRGVLLVDNVEELKSLFTDVPAGVQTFRFPNEQPITKLKDPMEIMAERAESNRTELRNLLKEKIDVIKARTANMPLPQLKCLYQLEKDWKKRKAVLTLVETLINNYTQSIMNMVGTKDIGGMIFNPNEDKLEKDMDITESEIEEVSLNIPTDEELDKLNG